MIFEPGENVVLTRKMARIYREKLQSLQDEIRTIQEGIKSKMVILGGVFLSSRINSPSIWEIKGTHSTFTETMTDIEMRREQTIHNAEYFKNYELTLSKHQYDQEMNLIQDEYEVKTALITVKTQWIDMYRLD